MCLICFKYFVFNLSHQIQEVPDLSDLFIGKVVTVTIQDTFTLFDGKLPVVVESGSNNFSFGGGRSGFHLSHKSRYRCEAFTVCIILH